MPKSLLEECRQRIIYVMAIRNTMKHSEVEKYIYYMPLLHLLYASIAVLAGC